jgi:pimeloyl-ACP methyl ester carboxylesterase
MTTNPEPLPVERYLHLRGATLEVFQGSATSGGTVVAAAHPASAYGDGTVRLLADTAQKGLVCINPRGIGASSPVQSPSLEETVDDIEAVRAQFGLNRWVFWGMSGGGWLAQIYGHRHPAALAGMIIESACVCFRERLADPACALSPFFPAWQEKLRALLAARRFARTPVAR